MCKKNKPLNQGGAKLQNPMQLMRVEIQLLKKNKRNVMQRLIFTRKSARVLLIRQPIVIVK
ncbi:MAG: hypothetical protein A3D92_10975 [Bacteroidetes bacterium RIFCSPHIGHO2_02_FULL_44_7]|nr:MAG: hypothetical protein A3D92_10975 [Bacteroidetes bacterium RIFCSPHIGHO2_02_FULL_44_7]